MNMKLSRRAWVRIITFLVALIVTLAALWGTAAKKNSDYQQKIEYTYLRAMNDLYLSLTNISSTLTKGMYCGSSDMLTSLSSKLWREAGFAKVSLSELPIDYFKLRNTYKFLSQVGDYSVSLAKKSADGQELTDEEYNNLQTLNQFCNDLLTQVLILEQAIQDGGIDLTKVQSELQTISGEDSSPSISDGFEEFEEGFSAFPTLIYDGPFSDHIMNREPAMLQGQTVIQREDARKIAAVAAGISPSELKDSNDEEGNMPSYGFTADNVDVSVTKNGGFVTYYLSYRNVEETKLTVDEGLKKAQEYLTKLGISSVKETYYEIEDHVLTVNFAHEENGVTVYTDLVKVAVAMDNGEILSFNQRGYLTNHHERQLASPSISQEQAQQKLSRMLTVEQVQLSIIPSAGQNEVYAYEFLCSGQDGQKVLVYINAETGAEEQILILLINENGTLTI